jgi:nucleotide-binding universal stress UspA family protein
VTYVTSTIRFIELKTVRWHKRPKEIRRWKFMKVLLAVDDSEYSRAALRAVMAQVHPQHTQVCVFHVVEFYLVDFETGMSGLETFEVLRQGRIEEGKKLLARFDTLLKRAGYSTTSVVKEGSPKAAIVEFAERWKADLIFVGSHGRKGWKRLTLGSVSEAVARHAGCSVEIVRVHPERMNRKQ